MHFNKILSFTLLFALAGCAGEDGTNGTNGVDGMNGDNGIDGVDGMDGNDGTDGLNGSDGMDGMDGIDGDNGTDGTNGDDGASVGVLNMSLTGLVNLGPDHAYEGWIIVNGAPVSTGVFHVTDDGFQTQSTFLVRQDDLDDATTFVLTIEPVPDPDAAPSSVHILGGDFASDSAPLSVGHAAAIGDDFSSAAGNFILATPTSTETDDENQGIWFLDPTAAGGPAPALDLPDLAGSGWTYEGWVVGPDGPISTGRFDNPGGADSDAAGVTAGPEGAPPFPGQDFITDARVLPGDYTAVITIEPEPDNSPGPFGSLKPLSAAIGSDIAPVLQSLTNDSASFPAGTVIR